MEDFEHVFVTISEIGIHTGGESGNWTEFTPDVTEVDLKPLIGENALEIWNGNLTPGEYNKVFIYVSDTSGILIESLVLHSIHSIPYLILCLLCHLLSN